MLEVLLFCVVVKVVIQSGVVDSVYIDISMGPGGFVEERVVPFSISGMDRVKVL